MIEVTIPRRPFSEWVADQIEVVCARNDVPRHGHEFKPAWEQVSTRELHRDLDQEFYEFLEALMRYLEYPSEKNRLALQWECGDTAAVLMMISARVDPKMSLLKRGR